MIFSQIGHYSLILGLCVSLYLLFYSLILYNKNKSNTELNLKIYHFSLLQLFLVILSFISLIISFIFSDFSNETVYYNSHTTKPLFYKIAGTWGNHEGSLLLWLLVLTLFIFLFILKSKNQPKLYRLLSVFFQQIIITGFFFFLLITSNPFNIMKSKNYYNIPFDKIPDCESLKDTFERVVPFYEKNIEPSVLSKKNILIVAHGNSLRALCKKIFNISESKIIDLEIPTGNPLLISFGDNLKVKNFKYLDIKRNKKIFFNV